MIVSGTIGIGRDYIVHNLPNWIDVEYMMLDDDWSIEQRTQKYIKLIKYLDECNYNIIFPDDEDLRKALIKNNIKYTYVVKLNGSDIKILKGESIAFLDDNRYLIDYLNATNLEDSPKDESKRRWWNGRHS